MAYRYFNNMITGKVAGEILVPRIGILTDHEDDLATLETAVNTEFLGVVDTGVLTSNPAARTMYVVGFPDDGNTSLQAKIDAVLGITP